MTLHRSENCTFFPCRQDGSADYIGSVAGRGFNINVAWNTRFDEKEQSTGLGSHEYRYACEELLFPIANEFQPDLILISCGFDSAIHDPLGESLLCPLAYFYMTSELLKICQKLVVVQEGGYNTDYLGQHASGVVKALLGVPKGDYGRPTQADRDAGLSKVEDIDGFKAKRWARDDV